MESVQRKFASRKFVAAIFGTVVSALLLVYGHIEAGQYIQALTVCVGGYMVANVVQSK